MVFDIISFMQQIQDLTMTELLELLFQHTLDFERNKANLETIEYYQELIETDIAEIQKRKGWSEAFSI